MTIKLLMNNDVLGIIGKFANVNLKTFHYNCDDCNNSLPFSEIISCTYSETKDSIMKENYLNIPELTLFIETTSYHFIYICPSCYDSLYKYKDIIVYLETIEMHSLEQLSLEMLRCNYENKIKKCNKENLEVNENEYLSMYTFYRMKDNKLIETSYIYEK